MPSKREIQRSLRVAALYCSAKLVLDEAAEMEDGVYRDALLGVAEHLERKAEALTNRDIWRKGNAKQA